MRFRGAIGQHELYYMSNNCNNIRRIQVAGFVPSATNCIQSIPAFLDALRDREVLVVLYSEVEEINAIHW